MSELGPIFSQALAKLLAKFNAAHERSQGAAEMLPADLWRALDELGLPLALISEENDGVGCDPADVFDILRTAGSYAPPVPLAEPLLAGWLASIHHLPPISGLATIAHTGKDSQLTAEVAGDSIYLNGKLAPVYWGRHARTVICVIEHSGQEILAALPLQNAHILEGYNIAGEPVDQLHLEAVAVPSSHYSVAKDKDWQGALWRYGALCRCAQMVGAMEAILELTLKYAHERHQFGQPIKKFQIIQQYLAVTAAEIAAATVAAKVALAMLKPWENEFLVAAAKSRVSEAVAQVTSIAHQVHGAMGFTAEYPLHLYTKRLWAWRDEYGSEVEWQEQLGRMVVGREQSSLWAMLTVLDKE